MEAKLKIVDAISKRHPSIGVKKGWSEYTGGMKDTGQWFTRVMLDVPEQELQYFLDALIAEENKPVAPLTEQEMLDQQTYSKSGKKGFMSEYDRKGIEKLQNDLERKLLFGE